MTNYNFKISDITFKVIFQDNNDSLIGHIKQYGPFLLQNNDDVECDFSLIVRDNEISDEGNEFNNLLDTQDEGISFKILRDANTNNYKIDISNEELQISECHLQTSNNFKEAKLYVSGSLQSRLFGFNNAMMMMFAFNGARLKALLFHSSVIKLNGKGYLFLGKSGTGKSTHSKLWLNSFEGAELLNDDNPVVYINNKGIAMVSGSPWSGKTPCYKNEEVPVGGFVRLWQAKENKISHLSKVHAYAALLPTISNMRWEHTINDKINETLDELIAKVPIFRLDCLPDKEAAMMSHSALTEFALHDE